MKQIKVTILGATGSIGKQALEVIRENPERLKVFALTANQNIEELISLAQEFLPKVVVVADETYYLELKEALQGFPIEVVAGEQALQEVCSHPEVDLVLSSLVGFAGLLPTLAAIRKGKRVALANKEVLVAAGRYVMSEAKKYGATILPVDSEHSAIYQCLRGEEQEPETLWLTASGGPFLNHSLDQLAGVTLGEALNHPRWKMGRKVTIDSATLANKGFEVIEARWLFDLSSEAIKVVIHPESTIHSLVTFRDGSMMAQLASPDMRLPISLALGVGERIPNQYKRLNLFDLSLHFQKPDFSRFPMLSFAYKALERGGNSTAILNAADSVAVSAFLRGEIKFIDIAHIVEDLLAKDFYMTADDLEAILDTDRRVEVAALHLIRQKYTI